ncbi:MAG: HPr(Ser) kinase/phosphatase [Deltaproteobacteria bacterium]|nr:MAG: HPr(Ser) kinase/phosphatase [Deltaproteobacteria bacterium]
MRGEKVVTVETLFEDPDGHLQAMLLSDWGGLDRKITRPRVQKAGLALAGFTKHVYGDRLQVLGLTEIDYLMSLDAERAGEVLEPYFAKQLCAVVLTRGLEPPERLFEEARKTKTPLFRTSLLSSTFIQRVTRRLETLLAPRASIHGVLMDVLGVGILLIGRSGVGKSEAALDLVLKGHRLVADDIVEVTVRPPDAIWGEATEFHQHHMEIRGMGILNITHLFGVAACRDNKKIEVVVELTESDGEDVDRLGTEGRVFPILGVEVPLVRIPLRPGRNIASLIEVVARNELLKVRGLDSARAFQAKVDARISNTAVEDRLPTTSSQRIPLSEVE